MKTIKVKAYSRRTKSGKIIQIKEYTRRVGEKGKHSPSPLTQSGDEFKTKVEELINPKIIAERKEAMEGFNCSEMERNSLGMSPERYAHYKLYNKDRKTPPPLEQRSQSPKKKGFLEKTEDKK